MSSRGAVSIVSENIGDEKSAHKGGPAHAIISRKIDFWMLGGASLAFFILLLIFQLLRPQSMDKDLEFFFPMFGVLAIFVNYPHFMISYKFGYGRGKKFIFGHWFSLLFVPVGLMGVLIWAYGNLSQLDLLMGIRILGWTLLFMSSTVFWHYLKQVFGCAMVYAKYDNYPISLVQRRIILGNLYFAGTINFLYSIIHYSNETAFSIPRIPVTIPDWIYQASYGVSVLSIFPLLYFVFYKNYKEKRVLPSLNFLVSWLALLIWFIPIFKSVPLFWLSVPFFHSLQYLPFAFRLENHGKGIGPNLKAVLVRKIILVISILLVGYMLFEGLPHYFDRLTGTQQKFHVLYYLAAFSLFLNIHHYFIDAVVWKFKDPEVRESLFGQTQA